MSPRRISKPPLIARALLGAPPRGLGSEVKVAFPDRVAVGIRARLKVFALDAHRHAVSLEDNV